LFALKISFFRIAVMKKADGKSLYVKIKDSQTLLDNLADFGIKELEKMHQTDELEILA
jgi:hypothetical protein